MMELLYAPTSPFCRKILIALDLLDLLAQVELTEVWLDPVTPNAGVERLNPLRKIPTLRSLEGAALYDSPVILDYLDAIAPAAKLFPGDAYQRIEINRRQSLADGIAEAAVSLRYETHIRPVGLRWDRWIEAQIGRINRGLDFLELEVVSLDELCRADAIAIACAMSYLDFRFPDLNALGGRPMLARFMNHAAHDAAFRGSELRSMLPSS